MTALTAVCHIPCPCFVIINQADAYLKQTVVWLMKYYVALSLHEKVSIQFQRAHKRVFACVCEFVSSVSVDSKKDQRYDE